MNADRTQYVRTSRHSGDGLVISCLWVHKCLLRKFKIVFDPTPCYGFETFFRRRVGPKMFVASNDLGAYSRSIRTFSAVQTPRVKLRIL